MQCSGFSVTRNSKIYQLRWQKNRNNLTNKVQISTLKTVTATSEAKLRKPVKIQGS